MLGVLDEGLGTAHRYSQPQGVSVFGCPDQTQSTIHVAGIYSLSCPLLSSHVDGHSGFFMPIPESTSCGTARRKRISGQTLRSLFTPFQPMRAYSELQRRLRGSRGQWMTKKTQFAA